MTETKDKMRIQVDKVLQMVHDDAVRETHNPELGYSSRATDRLVDLIAESNREAYTQGAIDAISAIVLDEKDLPEGLEKVKSVQMKKAKEFLKDL